MIATAYASAGVDTAAGGEAVERMRAHVARTSRPGVVGGLGGFGAAFVLDTSNYRYPVLVSATDGVGTKLLIAAATGRWDTVGIDLVAMCVNDVVAMGAEPLFFLDYIATGRVDPQAIERIVAGIADGCVRAGCALVGGETAEMPGMYAPGHTDLAGFVVGVVERDAIPSPSRVRAGDALVALAADGLHANGFSLVRRALLEQRGMALGAHVPELGCTLADELLRPTRIYVRPVLSLLGTHPVRALAHITGGGLLENLPRALPDNLAAHIDLGSWHVPPVFALAGEASGAGAAELHGVFNMGVGMVLVLDADAAPDACRSAAALGERAWVLGRVEPRAEGAPAVVLQ